MKIIQIPTTSNPFIVNINNRAYQYKGGETIEVPDEVAEAIEDALELEPKPKRYLSKFAQRVEGSITEVDESDFEGIEIISSHAFASCHGITKITIPNAVKTIGNRAFYACNILESAVMGNNITSIGSSAFSWCPNMRQFYLPEVPPTINIDSFDNINTGCVFYCKTQASLDAYKAAPIWSTLTSTYSFVVEA